MNRFLNFPFVYFFQFCEVSGLYNLIKSWWIMFLQEGLNSELRWKVPRKPSQSSKKYEPMKGG